jgi:two-component system response regulator YesN
LYGDVSEGLDAIIKYSPDILITDIRMPEMTGLELIEHIRLNIEQDIEIIILSGYEMFSYAKTAMQYGVNYYLVKPLFEEDMTPVLKELATKIEAKRRLEAISIFNTNDYANECLLGAIHGSQPMDLKKKLENIREIAPEKQCCFIQVELINKTDEESIKFRKKRMVKERIEQILMDEKMSFLLDQDSHSFGIILGLESKEILEGFVNKLFSQIEKLTEVLFYISVGSIVKEINNIRESYHDAANAMNYKIFNEVNSIIYYSEIETKLTLYDYDKLNSVQHLLEFIEVSDHAKIEPYINDIFSNFKKESATYDMVKIFTIQIIFSSLNVIGQMGGNANDFIKNNPVELFENEKNVISIHDIRKYIIDYCKKFKSFINDLRVKQKYSDYYAIEKYINENYRRNLTIKELSETFYMHPVYLGQILNKRLGMSFHDYIHKLRIEESITLFANPESKLNKIAENVGYDNYYNYLKHFEKLKGMKPNIYRAQLYSME